MLYDPLSFHDRCKLGKKLKIPSNKLQKIEIEASQKSNTSEEFLTMMIEYWLNEVNDASLYDLANAFDELDIKEIRARKPQFIRKLYKNSKQNEMKLSDRIRQIQLETPVVARDVERIVQILDINKELCNKLEKELGLNLLFHCYKFIGSRKFNKQYQQLEETYTPKLNRIKVRVFASAP